MSQKIEHEAEFVVRSELGLHARPAGQFVILAGSFQSETSREPTAQWTALSTLLARRERGTCASSAEPHLGAASRRSPVP